MPKKYRGKTDRQQTIDWLKENVEYYKKNIGEHTEYETLITYDLIASVMVRIVELEEKENVNNGRLSKLYI